MGDSGTVTTFGAPYLSPLFHVMVLPSETEELYRNITGDDYSNRSTIGFFFFYFHFPDLNKSVPSVGPYLNPDTP